MSGGGKFIGGATAGAGLMAIALEIATPQITTFEGMRTRAYKDVVGVLTVCAGHTGKDIVANKTYTLEECNAMTEKDAKIHADGVLAVSPHLIYHPMQLAAATSFTYNVGVGAYAKSTVAKRFNAGDFQGACNYMLNYKYAGGRVWRGLEIRREQERKICLTSLTKEGYANGTR